MIRDDGENVWFDEIARMTRIEREAVEAKRRQIEIKARGEQDERFKQVMEIHQEISKLVSDRLTDHVIDEYANEVAVTLLKNAIADQNNTRRDDEHIEQDLQEFLMHSANTT
ncbi:uncharacterized protein LOC112688562 [Sipha flava]|uniref:Uncharacterized protein LOC112688562 n=1 Tax=Sipha flava TaxID=143950 RepID=A0A8B8G4T6_9HEMI|nr:uncharacterized protein LOC112688562 [Sipha flava]